MLTPLRFILLLGLVLPALGQSRLGNVVVDVDKATIPVRVSANTEELNRLANEAFRVHGRYRVVASNFTYDLRFTLLAPNQVRVDVLAAGGSPVASQVVNGATPRQALLRAADLAVAETNGLGLHGFFTARIAFIGERTGRREVYVSDLFLGEAKQVTRDNAQVLTPRWSPDGTRVVYTSFFKNGFPDIYEYDLNTYQRSTLVTLRGSNLGARFSPNGQQLAMVLSGEGTSEIYVSNAQGKAIARRTHSDRVKASPCWSPDGSRLVFTMEPGPQLYVMPAAGGPPRRLTTGSTYAAEPDWSRANPARIACTVQSGGRYQIAVYDDGKGAAAVVSKAPFDGIEPCWLADGRHLVYTARERSTSVLCILDTDTGKSTAISGPFGAPAYQANVWTP